MCGADAKANGHCVLVLPRSFEMVRSIKKKGVNCIKLELNSLSLHKKHILLKF